MTAKRTPSLRVAARLPATGKERALAFWQCLWHKRPAAGGLRELHHFAVSAALRTTPSQATLKDVVRDTLTVVW